MSVGLGAGVLVGGGNVALGARVPDGVHVGVAVGLLGSTGAVVAVRLGTASEVAVAVREALGATVEIAVAVPGAGVGGTVSNGVGGCVSLAVAVEVECGEGVALAATVGESAAGVNVGQTHSALHRSAPAALQVASHAVSQQNPSVWQTQVSHALWSQPGPE